MFKKFIKNNYFHLLYGSITIGLLLYSYFLFGNSLIRFKESICDIRQSIKYYFCEIFDIENNINVSVINKGSVQFNSIINLPDNYETFKLYINQYLKLIISKDNLNMYGKLLLNIFYYIFKYFLLFIFPLILIFILLFDMYVKSENNNFNKDSKILIIFKSFENKVLLPIKNWFKKARNFLNKNDLYIKIWLFFILIDFNIITIIIEFVSFYLFFVMSFDFSSIYMQFYKLICDFSSIFILPKIFLIIVFFVIFDKICKNIALKRLIKFDDKNYEFINERPLSLMFCGTMGKKKTTTITDIAISEEIILKNKAFEKLLENDFKFPNFPWINLENTIKQALKLHKIYNLATIEKFIQYYKTMFELSEKSPKQIKTIKRYLKKEYCYTGKINILFDYDYKKYGLTYDDKLKVVDIFSVLETYSKLYFVYLIQSSLIISNYSIRTDNIIDDIGNFPLWNTDYFNRDSKTINDNSNHAHIIDFDAFRLGQKVIIDNKNKDSFDFGVVVITEIGKERKNTLELKETKKNDETNQKNDGFNDWLKMVRHSATIDNYPFVKVISDEQRPSSLGADARELVDLVYIKNASEMKLTLPFFDLYEILYDFTKKKFTKLYYEIRHNRSDNTLFMYFVKKILSMIINHYIKIYNLYGYSKLDLQIKSGTMDGVLSDKNYYLMCKKIYSNRFSTDCFSDFFNNKNLKSSVGINDLICYKTEKASIRELEKQNSYFINDLTNKISLDKKKK